MQGVGPFSEPVLIRVDPDILFFNPDDPERSKTSSSTATAITTIKMMPNPEVVSPPELAPRFNLILQVRGCVNVLFLLLIKCTG